MPWYGSEAKPRVSNRSDLGSHAFDTAMMELCKCSGEWSFRMSCFASIHSNSIFRQLITLAAFVTLYGRYEGFFFLLNNRQHCYSCFRSMDGLRRLLLHDLKLKRTQNISILA